MAVAGSNPTSSAIVCNGNVVAPTFSNKTRTRMEIGVFHYGWVRDGVWDVAAWSIALPNQDYVAVSNGFCPILVRPASLLGYRPLGAPHAANGKDRMSTNYHASKQGTWTESWIGHQKTHYPTNPM